MLRGWRDGPVLKGLAVLSKDLGKVFSVCVGQLTTAVTPSSGSLTLSGPQIKGCGIYA